MRPPTDERRPRQQLRHGELFLWLPWALGTLLLSVNFVAPRLFLIYRYGWQKVQQDHLRILRMPKGADWPVSNGDMIRDGFFLCFLIALFCWFAMFFATYPLVRRLLPAAKRPVA
jgi:hypothetical protein